MVVLCDRCQSINPDDATSCYKCGLKLIPKAAPYSINRTPLGPIQTDTIWLSAYLISGLGVFLGFILAGIFLLSARRENDLVKRRSLKRDATIFAALSTLSTVVFVFIIANGWIRF